MKPEEFIKTFQLNKKRPSEEFWDEFREDFKRELILVKPDKKGFGRAVETMNWKWDKMRYLTGNKGLDDNAWKWFYATTVTPVRNALFLSAPLKNDGKMHRQHENFKEQVSNPGFYPNGVIINPQPVDRGIEWEKVIFEVIKFLILRRKVI